MIGISLYFFTYIMLTVLFARFKTKSRLKLNNRQEEKQKSLTVFAKNRVLKHLQLLLVALDSPINLGTFLFITFIMAAQGAVIGSYVFKTFQAAVLLGFLLGSSLYLFLRWLHLGFRTKTIFELLPAVESFLQAYVSTPSRNMKLALNKSLPAIRYPVRHAFEHLSILLAIYDEPKEALEIFSFRFGSKWADQFSSIIRVGIRGFEMTEALEDLIQDMRDAQEDNKKERARLAEIRLANIFSVISFVALMFLNLKLGTRFELYYINEQFGQRLLLFNIAYIFFSIILGVYVSRNRM